MWKEVLSVGVPVLTLGTVVVGTWHLSIILSKMNEKIVNIEKNVEKIEKKMSKHDKLIAIVLEHKGMA